MYNYDHYKKKVNVNKIFKEILLIYFVAIFLVFLINSMILQAFKIPSNSMEPLLSDNTYIFVNKFIYGPKYPFSDIRIFNATNNIKRGDVIVFMSNKEIHKNKFYRFLSSFLYTLTFSLLDLHNIIDKDEPNILIKRIIGIPNDVIQFKLIDNKAEIYINNISEKSLINNHYITIEENEKNSPLISKMILKNEIKLNRDEYFMIGDNRVASVDSRTFGAISSKQIIGKAILKYYPKFGVIK
jgi:signal peptidase I